MAFSSSLYRALEVGTALGAGDVADNHNKMIYK